MAFPHHATPQFDGGLQRAAGAERFVCYDFNNLETLPAAMHHTFDMVVIDPPFITEEVWSKYADATRLLLKCDDRGTMQVHMSRFLGCSQADSPLEKLK